MQTMATNVATSCEENILHILDVAAAIEEHRKQLSAKGYLTQAGDQMLTAQLQMAQNEFHQTRRQNFERIKTEEKNLKSMAEKEGSVASTESCRTEINKENSCWIWFWSCCF